MNVDVSAPTHRSLCFNLWLMYCRILRQEVQSETTERRSTAASEQTHTPVHNQVPIVIAHTGPHVPELSICGLRVRTEHFSDPAIQKGREAYSVSRSHILVQPSEFGTPFLTPFGRS